MMQRIARFGFVLVVALICLTPRGSEAAEGPSDVVRLFYDALLNDNGFGLVDMLMSRLSGAEYRRLGTGESVTA